jgi:hypothetical protein
MTFDNGQHNNTTENTMTRFMALCCAALLVACAPSDEQAAMETSEAPTIALGDVAGTWAMDALTETGDSAIVTMEMTATDSYDGWTITFTDRDPIATRVIAVGGDSIVSEFGPYESALRAGVMVTTTSVIRLDGDNLVGTFMARYETTEADSILRGQLRGMRSQ